MNSLLGTGVFNSDGTLHDFFVGSDCFLITEAQAICGSTLFILFTAEYRNNEAIRFHRQITRPFFTRERISDFDTFDAHANDALTQAKIRLSEGYPIDFQVAPSFLLFFSLASNQRNKGPRLSIHPRLSDPILIRQRRSLTFRRTSLPRLFHTIWLPRIRQPPIKCIRRRFSSRPDSSSST